MEKSERIRLLREPMAQLDAGSNVGVLEMIRLPSEGCRRTGRHSGICRRAPSDHPEFAEFLLAAGIDSISLSRDSIVAATRRILSLEAKLPDARH